MMRESPLVRFWSLRRAVGGLALTLLLGVFWPDVARGAGESPFPQRIKLSEFPEGLEWLNSPPRQLKDFRGRFVLLDFWTYCCINCMHILPELKKAEDAYPKELTVIGVHSAKFTTEQDSRNIREAIARYEIRHPVINDSQHVFWQRFEVNTWPTLLLIDPEGYLVWGTRGEITFEFLDKVLKPAIAFYRKKGLLVDKPLPAADNQQPAAATTPLRFPGKIIADEAGNRLFIADSNHNRVVIADLSGRLLATIGGGRPGRADGDFARAEFNHPQGMALHGGHLYVADTENHLLRRVDLVAQRVTTIAGIGRQGREALAAARSVRPTLVALNSPWDLWVQQKQLFIAMAGSHQIWRMSLDGESIGPYAGNAREDIVDGPLLPRRPYELGSASFAQPSGLTSDGAWLYVVDSEGSSIRAVPFQTTGAVRTLVGTSGLPQARLFTFGDVDGPAAVARLQHPLGAAFYRGKLYVADTYNNKIKAVATADGSVSTVAGDGRPGDSDAPARFDEPAGISAANGKLYVADTNNHAIRVIELGPGQTVVRTLAVEGLKPPAAQQPVEPAPARKAD